MYQNRSILKIRLETTGNQVQEVKDIIVSKPTVIKENGTPNKFLIKTTFVPQAPEKDWSEPWQDACEEAALLTADYYYKNQNPNAPEIKTSILNMINFENKQGWGKDVNLEQMAIIASDYLHYQTKIIDNPNIDQIQAYISQGIPVIVPANGKILYQENKYFKSGGPYYHNVVILGYDDTKKQFTVHDVGTQFGAYFKYSYNLLMESIHDFPPSGHKEDINTGDKRVLVLLK